MAIVCANSSLISVPQATYIVILLWFVLQILPSHVDVWLARCRTSTELGGWQFACLCMDRSEGRRMTRSRWRGCESLQEMKVRFASTLLPPSSSLLPSLYRVAIEYHTLGPFTIWTTFKIAEYRIQNTKLYWPFLQTSQPVSEISCRHNCTRWCMYKYTHTHWVGVIRWGRRVWGEKQH